MFPVYLLIHFIWVPSHCGIPGNEIADRLTKVVFRFDPKINEVEIRKIDAKLSYCEIKILIRQLSSEKWNTYYKSYPAGGQYKLLYPHTTSRNTFQSKEIFRLQTSHCLLNYHSQRIGLHNSGLCDQCKVPETVQHLLFPNFPDLELY